MFDSIFGQTKAYKSICQWYILTLNKGLAVWERDCKKRVQIALS